MSTPIYITGEEMIGDLLAEYPETEEIMKDYGLHCTSCSVNQFEPLKYGVMSHGIPEEVADEMIERLNTLVHAKNQAKIEGIYVSPRAAKKIQEFAEAEEKTGYALQISASENPDDKTAEPLYSMDFVEQEKEGDHVFEFHGQKIVVDANSFALLEGCEVDFIQTNFASGFKISNPSKQKKKGCGSGACGCGTGKGAGGCGTGGCGC